MYQVSQRFEQFGDSYVHHAASLKEAQKVADEFAEDILVSFYDNNPDEGWRRDGDEMVYTPVDLIDRCRVGNAAYWDMVDEIESAMTSEDGETWVISRDEMAEIIKARAIEIKEEA